MNNITVGMIVSLSCEKISIMYCEHIWPFPRFVNKREHYVGTNALIKPFLYLDVFVRSNH